MSSGKNANKGGIVRVVKRDESYTIIDPTFMSDPRISWKAKGILGYLLSKPSNWQVYVSDLVKRSTDGRDAVYSGLDELIAAGYVERSQPRIKGRYGPVTYTVYERAMLPDDPEPYKPPADADNPLSDTATPNTENPNAVAPNPIITEHNSININNIDYKNKDRLIDGRASAKKFSDKNFNSGCKGSSPPKNDHTNILDTLADELRAIPFADNSSVTLYDHYFDDIYAMLVRRFPEHLSPDIIRIAADRYINKTHDMRTMRYKAAVHSPIGMFCDAYKDALATWQAKRYRCWTG